MPRLPSLFVSHGAPNLVLHNTEARRFLAGFAAEIPRPRAILVASAHFESAAPQATSDARPATVHDFRGFERELYDIRYPAPGDPALAARAVDLFKQAGFSAAGKPGHGFDHGTWVPLSLLYPEAAIPVVQLSVQPREGPAHHLSVGTALASLADEGVLVMGSGSLTHNLHEVFNGGYGPEDPAPDWVRAFGDWMHERLDADARDDLMAYRERAPFAVENHPSDEHLLPLFVALGAAGAGARGRRVHTSREYGVLMMDAYLFH